MGIELTQWTLVKPGRLGSPRRTVDDSVWLKAPSGEMQLLPLASLAAEIRTLIAELASGSKVPKGILGDILAARSNSDLSCERSWERPWTFHHLDPTEGFYVYLSPPPERGARPVAFSLADLRPQLRAQLDLLTPGDAVGEELIAALQSAAALSLAGAPFAVASGHTSRR